MFTDPNNSQSIKNKKKLILPPIYPYKGNLSKKLESLRHEKEYHKIFFNEKGLKRKLDRTKFNIIQAGFEKDEDDIKNQNEGRKKIMNSYNFNKKLDEFERFVNENCNEEEDYKENESHYSTESEKLKKEEERRKIEEEEKKKDEEEIKRKKEEENLKKEEEKRKE